MNTSVITSANNLVCTKCAHKSNDVVNSIDFQGSKFVSGLTHNQGVLGSSPSGTTKKSFYTTFFVSLPEVIIENQLQQIQ